MGQNKHWILNLGNGGCAFLDLIISNLIYTFFETQNTLVDHLQD